MSEENQPEVYKVIGAPGTGKTTRVVGNPELPDVTSLVMENLKQGYSIDDQMIVTYTKAGTTEAADRLEKMLDTSRNKLDDRVVTIHAKCYRLLGVDQDQVVRFWHKQNFCDQYDLDFGYSDDEQDIMGGDQEEGNALFDIYGWLKSNRKELDEWEDCPAEYPGSDDPEFLMERWEEYKKEEDLIQFSDMIEMVVERGVEVLHENSFPNVFSDQPDSAMETFRRTKECKRFDPQEWRGVGPFIDTQILYVDEVQDLTPLQWCWYLMQKLVCEKVYIGGDDDQSIYGWAGADPEFMLGEEGDFEVLDKTYRIPAEVWGVCDKVIRQVDNRQEKNVEPDGDGGSVSIMKAPSPVSLKDHLLSGDTFVLFRARYMIDEFREDLHNMGIPYRNMSTHDTWEGDIKTLRDALAKIKNGEDKVGKEEAEALMNYAFKECNNCYGRGCYECDDGQVKMVADGHGFNKAEAAMSNFGGVPMERVEQILEIPSRRGRKNLDWMAYIEKSEELNYYEKEAIKGNLRKNNEHLDPEDVRVGTIHSSKGKEAETVILPTDSTKTIMSNMAEETADRPDKNISDAERRVYYVGMTRASDTLVMVQGLVNPETSIPLDDLLPDYSEDGNNWTVQNAGYEQGW